MVIETLRPYAEVFDRCFVVVRHDDDQVIRRIEEGMEGRVEILRSGRSHLGMGASLAEGVPQVVTGHDLQALFVGLGDMPCIKSSSLVTLRETMRRVLKEAPRSIIRPRFGDSPGHPVGFTRAFFGELLHTSGDIGARQIIESHRDCVISVSLNDPGVCLDFDVSE